MGIWKGSPFKVCYTKIVPAKNSVKQFVENTYYHIYNRGVEKRIIFQDQQDYGVFLSYLKDYLTPKDDINLMAILHSGDSNPQQKSEALKMIRMNNFTNTIDLLAYCLMSNHFHLLVKQSEPTSIDSFMNSLTTRYSMYFNKRNKRVGHLFQGTYKAVLVETEEQLLHLSRYIHKNPLVKGVSLQGYPYSTYPNYLGLKQTGWIKPTDILSYFSKSGFNSYESFVEGSKLDYDSTNFVRDLILDE